MSRSRSVLFIGTEVFANGGIQRFNRTFLAANNVLGVEVDVCTVRDSNDAAADSSVRCRRLWGHAGSKTRFALRTIRQLSTVQYDVIVIGHINYAALTAAATLARWPWRRRLPRVILVTHGVEIWSRLKGLRRTAIRFIDRTLCVSTYTRQSIIDQAPEVDPRKLTVFHNALDRTWTTRTDAMLRGSHGPPVRPYLLSVARLTQADRSKGIVTTIRALARSPNTDLQYVIAGGGNDLEALRALAVDLGLRDRVSFPGSVSDDELEALYRGCAAFVLPSSQEGFGIVFLEAMYFGAPVIAAAEKGARDVVIHGKSGLTVPYDDSEALGAAIDAIATDNRLRERLRLGGLSQVTGSGRFTFEAFVKRWDTILGEELR